MVIFRVYFGNGVYGWSSEDVDDDDITEVEDNILDSDEELEDEEYYDDEGEELVILRLYVNREPSVEEIQSRILDEIIDSQCYVFGAAAA